MMNLFDKFMEEYEEFVKATGLDEKAICNDAFENNADCECTYEGSDDYFDTRMMQWYPGDGPEFEVTGFDNYINEIVNAIAEAFTAYYNVPTSDELIALIRENLCDIFQDELLDECGFEERAIDKHYNDR